MAGTESAVQTQDSEYDTSKLAANHRDVKPARRVADDVEVCGSMLCSSTRNELEDS